MLYLTLIFPLISIIMITFKSVEKEVYKTALFFSQLNLIHTLFLFYFFVPNSISFQFQSFGIFGIDGISLWLIWLVNMLTPIVLLSCWKIDIVLSKSFVIYLLIIQILSLAVFIVLDLLLFYISFESVLIPMFFLIAFWGSRNRKIHAAYQFFMYTLIGSLFLLLSIVQIYIEIGTSDYHILSIYPISANYQNILWLAFFISFAIKIPMFPMHIWLPEAHVEAPTAASVILAAILLKQGSYGFLRYSLPIFNIASITYQNFLFCLCLLGIIYASIVCQAQWDIKKIIAYSSVGHMNLATLGLFTQNQQAINGGIYFLLSHGIISAGLFLLVGILYDRYHTRTVRYYRGIVMFMPIFTLIFFIFSLANIAVPGTSGFIAEFLIFVGLFQNNLFIALFATLAIILTPSFMLWVMHKMLYGTISTYQSCLYQDMTRKEFHMLFPLLFFLLFFGIYPVIILESLQFNSMNVLF